VSAVDIREFAQAEVIAVVSVLRAYLDEFDDYENPNCVVYGIQGMVGPVHLWHQLQCNWEDALECCGVKYFHATDLNSSNGEFKGWTMQQRHQLTNLLVKVVRDNLSGFRLLGSAMFMSSYKKLPEYRRCKLRNPYFLSAVSVMSDAVRFSHFEFGNRPVEFIFDQKTKHTHWIDEAYDDVLSTKWGHLCAARSMANHRLVSPVQIADLVAYETEKYIAKRVKQTDSKDLEPGEFRWQMKELKELFFPSDTTLYTWHALMLVTDFWGNYKRMCNALNIKTEETHNERKNRLQEIR
jgi:hypothetical protein